MQVPGTLRHCTHADKMLVVGPAMEHEDAQPQPHLRVWSAMVNAYGTRAKGAGQRQKDEERRAERGKNRER